MVTWVPGAQAAIEWSDMPSSSERDEVRVHVVQGHRDPQSISFRAESGTFAALYPDAVGQHGGSNSSATFSYGIARLIGHDPRDLSFI